MNSLDGVFHAVTMSLGADAELVKKFEEATRAKLLELMPSIAEKAALEVADQVAHDATRWDSEMRKTTLNEVVTYFKTESGSAHLREKVHTALALVLEGDVLKEVVREYVKHEIGELANEAVKRAVRASADRARKKAKKEAAIK